jgi:hypothetical protein
MTCSLPAATIKRPLIIQPLHLVLHGLLYCTVATSGKRELLCANGEAYKTSMRCALKRGSAHVIYVY